MEQFALPHQIRLDSSNLRSEPACSIPRQRSALRGNPMQGEGLLGSQQTVRVDQRRQHVRWVVGLSTTLDVKRNLGIILSSRGPEFYLTLTPQTRLATTKMAEHRHLASCDPQWVDFPKNLPEGTKVYGMNRNRDPITPQPGLDIAEFDVTVREGAQITLRTYRKSESADAALPLFVYIHGGGFVTGGLETDDSTCRAFALETGLAVVNVEYRLAPEHKFPVGFENCFDVVRWVASADGQEKLKTDLAKAFILGGTSAGANFTAGISHLALEEALSPPLTGVVFLAGSFCHPDARPQKYLDRILSVDEITEAPGLTRKSIDYFAGQYGAPPADRRLSPLLFDSHAGIAKKAYFSVCGLDPRRDEALLFEQLLRDAGLETRSDVYPGLPHGFWTTCPDLPASREWLRKLIEGMRWVMQ
ncbi:AB hydrolase superfamily protein B1A11.02 [Tolypocladium ophioglossoides CBS 100239]|uniref:AB hydrolase superfamily protein B1A11.02 n=1 Tax=Tolypocladium ophioglossoides (strain CBS 100239) TaxID=1163406 RepID=A0A0L0N388_TOLOC|nr:AB hydrolase superfamily protein B1A11.02 [Tolypocladium ophioglossoides CBS 100239]